MYLVLFIVFVLASAAPASAGSSPALVDFPPALRIGAGFTVCPPGSGARPLRYFKRVCTLPIRSASSSSFPTALIYARCNSAYSSRGSMG